MRYSIFWRESIGESTIEFGISSVSIHKYEKSHSNNCVKKSKYSLSHPEKIKSLLDSKKDLVKFHVLIKYLLSIIQNFACVNVNLYESAYLTGTQFF